MTKHGTLSFRHNIRFEFQKIWNISFDRRNAPSLDSYKCRLTLYGPWGTHGSKLQKVVYLRYLPGNCRLLYVCFGKHCG